jgi:thiol-disulfide isomerase/thioredoxin
MTRPPRLAAALLYAALSLTANPAAALTPGERAGLEALKAGDMRKLVVAETPEPAPDITVTRPDGTETTLAAREARLRVVNFWATWCAPCRAEMPALVELGRARADAGLELVLVATGRNSPEAIARFAEDVGLPDLDTLLDPQSRLAAAMGVPGLPVTVLLDADGAEIARLLGEADWRAPEALAVVDYLLALPQ